MGGRGEGGIEAARNLLEPTWPWSFRSDRQIVPTTNLHRPGVARTNDVPHYQCSFAHVWEGAGAGPPDAPDLATAVILAGLLAHAARRHDGRNAHEHVQGHVGALVCEALRPRRRALRLQLRIPQRAAAARAGDPARLARHEGSEAGLHVATSHVLVVGEVLAVGVARTSQLASLGSWNIDWERSGGSTVLGALRRSTGGSLGSSPKSR